MKYFFSILIICLFAFTAQAQNIFTNSASNGDVNTIVEQRLSEGIDMDTSKFRINDFNKVNIIRSQKNHAPSYDYWSVTGNGGIGSDNYLGTIEPQDLVIKTNTDANNGPANTPEIARFFGDNTYRITLGFNNSVGEENSIAMGKNTTAEGKVSTAMGAKTLASGAISFASGVSSTASGNISSSMGLGSLSPSYVETAIGAYNENFDPISKESWSGKDRLFTIGNGTGPDLDNRHNAFIVMQSGNVGINLKRGAIPIAILDVNGNTNITGDTKISGTTTTSNLQITNGATNGYILQSDANGLASWVSSSTLTVPDKVNCAINNAVPKWNSTTNKLVDGIMSDNATTIGIGLTGAADPNAKLQVNGTIYSTKVFVGTSDAQTYSQMTSGTTQYLLAVNGNAIFNRAQVKLYGSWPDYVFEDKYNLLPLVDLEQYVIKNKHLPNVPSAAQIEKEGIDLGNNQTILLQKIEELTLYTIEQNKKMQVQNDTLQQQQKQIDELKALIKK